MSFFKASRAPEPERRSPSKCARRRLISSSSLISVFFSVFELSSCERRSVSVLRCCVIVYKLFAFILFHLLKGENAILKAVLLRIRVLKRTLKVGDAGVHVVDALFVVAQLVPRRLQLALQLLPTRI